MKKIFLLFTIFTAVNYLVSCDSLLDPPGVITGKGPVVTADSSLVAFDEVKCRLGADISIFESDDYYVEVTMQENLFPHLKLDISNKKLDISFGGVQVNTREIVHIKIFTPFLSSFSLSGAGDVFSEIPIENLKLTGSGDFICEGETDRVNVDITGVGDFDLFSMPVNYANIRISGTGDVKVDVQDTLDVRISGVGKVYYRGNPVIFENITGVGEIIDSN